MEHKDNNTPGQEPQSSGAPGQGEKGTLRGKVTSGLFWTYAERILAQGVTAVVSIVLARLLAPDDYGIISIVSIFISICEVFVTSGFGNALVQKKEADDLDFSSIFYFSLGIAAVLYAGLFLSAPLIANFYGNGLLGPVIRVLGVRLLLSSVNSVQRAYVSKRMAFRKFFRATIFGTVVSAAAGIAMACLGFGVWALVAQYLTNSLIDTVVLFFSIEWRPKRMFSLERMKGLVSYGWKMLASSLLEAVYNNLRSLIIGKKYSEADLAFYDKGKHFPELIVLNINSSISSVIFPAIANVQDDRERVRQLTRRSIRVGVYLMCPLLLGLATVAEPVVRLLLTDKWLPAVPFLRIACFNCLLYPIHTANLQPVIALGRSDIYLRLEIVKKAVGLSVLAASVIFFDSVLAIAAGTLVFSLMALVINAWYNRALFGYGLLQELRDIFPTLALGAAMSGAVYLAGLLPLPLLPLLIVQILVGAAFYLGLSWLTRMESYRYIIDIAKGYLRRKRERS